MLLCSVHPIRDKLSPYRKLSIAVTIVWYGCCCNKQCNAVPYAYPLYLAWPQCGSCISLCMKTYQKVPGNNRRTCDCKAVSWVFTVDSIPTHGAKHETFWGGTNTGSKFGGEPYTSHTSQFVRGDFHCWPGTNEWKMCLKPGFPRTLPRTAIRTPADNNSNFTTLV